MKKFILLFVIIVINLSTYAQINKVAVVTVFGNKMIDGSDFGSVTALRTLADDKNFNLDSMVNVFKEKLFRDFSNDFTFSLLEETSVTGNSDYKSYCETEKGLMADYYYTTPVGYYFLYETNKQSEKLFDIFKNETIDGIMYVSLDYKLYKTAQIAGFGTAKVYAYVNVKIFNAEGEKIFVLRECGISDNNLKFALGGTVIEAKEIMPLCSQATANAFIEMKEKLPKSIEKMNKKIKN